MHAKKSARSKEHRITLRFSGECYLLANINPSCIEDDYINIRLIQKEDLASARVKHDAITNIPPLLPLA